MKETGGIPILTNILFSFSLSLFLFLFLSLPPLSLARALALALFYDLPAIPAMRL